MMRVPTNGTEGPDFAKMFYEAQNCMLSGEDDRALGILLEMRALARTARDNDALAKALSMLAGVHFNARRLEEALAACAESIELQSKEEIDPYTANDQAQTRTLAGMIWMELRNHEQATKELKIGLRLVNTRIPQGSLLKARLQMELAECLLIMGRDPEHSLELFEGAWTCLRRSSRDELPALETVKCALRLAQASIVAARQTEAKRWFVRAHDLLVEHEHKLPAFEAVNDWCLYGRLALELGEVDKSDEAAAAAYRLYTDTGQRGRFSLAGEVASLLVAVGQHANARQLIEDVRSALKTEVQSPLVVVGVLQSLADCANSLHEQGLSVQLLKEALGVLSAMRESAALAGDPVGAERAEYERARCYWTMSGPYRESGQYDEAVECATKAYDWVHANLDEKDDLWVLTEVALGSALADKGRNSSAILREALGHLQSAKTWYDNHTGRMELRRAKCLLNLASILSDLREYPEASALYAEAVEVYRCDYEAGRLPAYRQREYVGLLADLGRALDEVGRHEDAAETLEEAVKIGTLTGNNDKAGLAQVDLGLALLERDPDRGRREIEQGNSLLPSTWAHAVDRVNVLQAQLKNAQALWTVGEASLALRTCENVIELAGASDLDLLIKIQAMNLTATVLGEDAPVKAVRILEQALRTLSLVEGEPHLLRARLLSNLGRHLVPHDPLRALEILNKAKDLFPAETEDEKHSSIRVRIHIARTLMAVAVSRNRTKLTTRSKAHLYREALHDLNEAREFYDSLHFRAPDIGIAFWDAMMRAHHLMRDGEMSHVACIELLKAIETKRAMFLLEDSRTNFQEDITEILDLIMGSVLKHRHYKTAFLAIQHLKGRIFYESLLSNQVKIEELMSPEDFSIYSGLTADVHRAASQLLIDDGGSSVPTAGLAIDTAVLEQRLTAATTRRAQLIKQLGARSPELAALTFVPPSTVNEVADALTDGEALLDFFEVGRRFTGAFLVQPKGLKSLVRGQTSVVRRARRVSETSANLIFGKVQRHLLDTHTLYVSPSAVTRQVPFQALATLIGLDVVIGIVPNASFVRHRAEPRPSGLQKVTVLACTRDGGIPGVHVEALLTAEQARAAGMECEIRLTGQRTSDVLLTEMFNCDILHIACHAAAGVGNESRAYLELDGTSPILDAVAIMQSWKLKATVVVLSSCESGGFSGTKGEEFLGLIRAVMRASGASCIVATSEPIHDVMSVTLVSKLYDGLFSGASVGEALRSAQRSLLNASSEELATEIQRLVERVRHQGLEAPHLSLSSVLDAWSQRATALSSGNAPKRTPPVDQRQTFASFFVFGDPCVTIRTPAQQPPITYASAEQPV